MARIDVLLPQWGMGMSEGAIVQWLKKVGEHVDEDEPLAEVEAEKVEETLESPATGTLVEILVEEGASVEVHHPGRDRNRLTANSHRKRSSKRSYERIFGERARHPRTL